MDIEDFKQLARNAYRKEYVQKTPIGLREKFFLYPAAAMLKGGAIVAGLGLFGMMFGVAIAAPIFAIGMLAVAGSLPLLHTGSKLADLKAEAALERDIENGVLVDHFRRTMLPQPQPQSAPVPGLDLTAAAAEAFSKPAVQQTLVTAPRPVLTPQPATP